MFLPLIARVKLRSYDNLKHRTTQANGNYEINPALLPSLDSFRFADFVEYCRR